MNIQQTGGVVGGTALSLWEQWQNIAYSISTTSGLEIVKTAIIGASVGFIATTILRLIWDNIVARYGTKYKFLKPKK